MATGTKQLKILIIEDQKYDYLLVQRTLSRSDLSVSLTWEQRGETALERLSRETFDIVLIDHQLPGITGLNVFEQMRDLYFNVPVIFVTGGGSEATAVTALKLGAQDYVVKDGRGDYLQLLPVIISKAYQQWENEKARLEAEQAVVQRAAELSALVEVSWALRAAATTEEMVNAVLQKTIKIAHAISATIFFIDRTNNDLLSMGSYPTSTHTVGTRHDLTEGILGEVARNGKVHISGNLLQNLGGANLPHRPYQSTNNLDNSITLPLYAYDDIIGVLHIILRTFSIELGQLLLAIADIAGNAFYRALVMETLEHHVTVRTAELTAANKRLRSLSHLQSKFISDVSHELRTPITNLSLYLNLLQKGRPERRENYISVLKKETARLTQLVEGILTMSRLDMPNTNKLEQRTPLYPSQLVETILDTYYDRAIQKGLQIKFIPDSRLPLIEGRDEQLKSLLTHILDNAIQYTDKGSVEIRLYATAMPEGICFQVTDTGDGIDPDDLEHVFERFYRGKGVSQSNQPGIGLGLSVARSIADLHNGRIQLRSQPGQGTTVSVYLPAYQPTPEIPQNGAHPT